LFAHEILHDFSVSEQTFSTCHLSGADFCKEQLLSSIKVNCFHFELKLLLHFVLQLFLKFFQLTSVCSAFSGEELSTRVLPTLDLMEGTNAETFKPTFGQR